MSSFSLCPRRDGFVILIIIIIVEQVGGNKGFYILFLGSWDL